MIAQPIPAWVEAGTASDPSRPVLVFLHGIGGGKQGFAAQLVYFADRGYRALAWDMPGYGDSAPIEPYDFAGLAQACEADEDEGFAHGWAGWWWVDGWVRGVTDSACGRVSREP